MTVSCLEMTVSCLEMIVSCHDTTVFYWKLRIPQSFYFFSFMCCS